MPPIPDPSITLAEAIRDDLAGITFTPQYGQTFTAAVATNPKIELKSLTGLQVILRIDEDAEELDGRKVYHLDTNIDVAIIGPCDPRSESAVAQLVRFVRDVRNHLRFKKYGSASWIGAVNSPRFDRTLLEQERTFVSVVTFLFRTTPLY